MPETFAYDVFLSHSAAPTDQATAREIATRLKKDGLKVWLAEWEIKKGDDAAAKTEAGLENSRAQILCLSAHAFKPAEWSRLEPGTQRFRDPQDTDRRFIPLRLDDAPAPGALASFLAIAWNNGAARQTGKDAPYTQLLAASRPEKEASAAVAAAAEELTPDQQGLLVRIQARFGPSDHTNNVLSVAWSPDGTRALSGADDKTVRLWEVASGRCLRVLEGHTNSVLSVAWSPDGSRALSGGNDKIVRLWEVDSGRCLRVLAGHTDSVYSVAWSPDGSRALSGGHDKTVRVWEVDSGRCLRVLEGHTSYVWSVAWSPDGSRALSGAFDNTLRLWEVDSGRCLRVLEGHTSYVLSVAWSPDGSRALSGAFNNTLRLWEVDSGRCLRVLEGHTDKVRSVAWSPDGSRALSGADDNTLRLWEVDSGRCLRVLKGHTESLLSVAWSPDGSRALSGAYDGNIGEWNLTGIERTRRKSTPAPTVAPPTQVQYTNAKVLLLGDTGVGKSGLAEQLVHGRFVATKSSHARQAHMLSSEVSTSQAGVEVHQETVLWDLAGQPAYRLVHQLSLEGAVVACVLFDNRNETHPFEGAAYWSQVLQQARSSTPIRKILVASRIDVGGLPASRERIDDFAKEQGFELFVPTSASTGAGCKEVLQAIRRLIPWDMLPTVTTEGPLAPLREYVAKLKGEKNSDKPTAPPELLTVAQLHEGFSAYYGKKIPLAEFVSYLQRLEATDALDVLVFDSTDAEPKADTLVLLDPTRVDAYASALLVAAKDEPDGPGHLLESRIREGNFTLDPDERLADKAAEKHVLWFVLECLLSRDLALRETIKGQDYIVFPSQCTAALRFPGHTSFGIALGFAGPVRSIYATLIAQLAHYEAFKKREFFHDAAIYRPADGGGCVVRLRDQGRGKGELELSFETETPADVRQGFIEFVSKHLEARSTLDSVTRRHAYHCQHKDCQKPFDDAVVKARLGQKKKLLLCPYCEKKTPLVDLLAPPSAAAVSVAGQITQDAATGKQRMTAALVIKAKEAEGIFDVFLSHNSKDKAAVEKIAKKLRSVGIRPWLDKWNLAAGDTVSDALEKAVKSISCAALCFGPADKGRWHIMEVRSYIERWANGDARMIPVILPGVKNDPELPLFVRQTLWVDMRDWESRTCDSFHRLIYGILGREPGDSPRRKSGLSLVLESEEKKKQGPKKQARKQPKKNKGGR